MSNFVHNGEQKLRLAHRVRVPQQSRLTIIFCEHRAIEDFVYHFTTVSDSCRNRRSLSVSISRPKPLKTLALDDKQNTSLLQLKEQGSRKNHESLAAR